MAVIINISCDTAGIKKKPEMEKMNMKKNTVKYFLVLTFLASYCWIILILPRRVRKMINPRKNNNGMFAFKWLFGVSSWFLKIKMRALILSKKYAKPRDISSGTKNPTMRMRYILRLEFRCKTPIASKKAGTRTNKFR